MKWKIRPIAAAVAAANALAIAGAAALTVIGSAAAGSQSYNAAAERWRGESGGDYSQISCFFSSDAGFTTEQAADIRGQLYEMLSAASVTPEEGKTLVPDAYSAPAGRATVYCELTGRSEAEITAVGGDFFLFRDFTLLDGAFFTDNDIMQDGAVIDRSLAWALYGSEDIAGKNIYINGVQLYISGVIDDPHTDPEERCAGEYPRAYISYYAASSAFQSGSAMQGGEASELTDFDKVTCYECIVPDPVENFAENSVDEILSNAYGSNVSIVNNSERFSPKKRAKALKKLDEYAIEGDSISLPYWENASRIVDFKLSRVYGARRWLIAVPVITLICLALKGFGIYLRKKDGFKKAAADFISAKWRALRKKLTKKTKKT